MSWLADVMLPETLRVPDCWETGLSWANWIVPGFQPPAVENEPVNAWESAPRSICSSAAIPKLGVMLVVGLICVSAGSAGMAAAVAYVLAQSLPPPAPPGPCREKRVFAQPQAGQPRRYPDA